MANIWKGITWNENGELVLDIYANPPVEETDEDLDEEFDESTAQHTYATIDCGGDCGACVALIVDGNVISGPPFHPNCQCTLSASDIETADYHASHLHQDVASNRNVDLRDVKWLKNAMAKLGYYTPDTKAGESENHLNQYPNQNLFDAIDDFRHENKIKEQGAVKPGHWTEIKINERLQKLKKLKKIKEHKTNNTDFEKLHNKSKEPGKDYTDDSKSYESQKSNVSPAEEVTFEHPVDTQPGYYAVFDGKKFTLYVDNKPVISWDAVSGRSGYQSPEYQDQKSTGPIPEGTYVARQEELQFINTRDAILGVAVILDIKKGGWPGSYYSWGNSRVWLEPSKETNTYGRDKFSIHGGWAPGSIGCIDLTSQMQNFVALFKFIDKDLIVKVKY